MITNWDGKFKALQEHMMECLNCWDLKGEQSLEEEQEGDALWGKQEFYGQGSTSPDSNIAYYIHIQLSCVILGKRYCVKKPTRRELSVTEVQAQGRCGEEKHTHAPGRHWSRVHQSPQGLVHRVQPGGEAESLESPERKQEREAEGGGRESCAGEQERADAIVPPEMETGSLFVYSQVIAVKIKLSMSPF